MERVRGRAMKTHIGRRVDGPSPFFRNRDEAGVALAEFVAPAASENALVLALPRGGIPVATPLATALNAPVDPLFARKLPIPSSPEMGFGAIAIDGSRVLNDWVVRSFGIGEGTMRSVVREVQREVERRAEIYGADGKRPDVRGKNVYVVDDGLATGYTAMAGAKMVRAGSPSSLTLCVPVSPADSISAVEPYFDEIYCLIAQESPRFAVASFYRDFHDLSDEEVIRILHAARRTRDEG